jgi:hypothetical protein
MSANVSIVVIVLVKPTLSCHATNVKLSFVGSNSVISKSATTKVSGFPTLFVPPSKLYVMDWGTTPLPFVDKYLYSY